MPGSRVLLAVPLALTMPLLPVREQTGARTEYWTPARFESGALPMQPPLAVSGGEVFLEVTVDPSGRVAAIRPLRTTAPFTDLMIQAVRGWRFTPATVVRESAPGKTERRSVASTVFVAGMFRPPTLRGPTLGEPPEVVGLASTEIPAPRSAVMPTYPPNARDAGVVLLEAFVDPDGLMRKVAVVRSAPPFDDAALRAFERWAFRGARRNGAPVPAFVYVAFGFRPPVVTYREDPEGSLNR